MAKTEDKPLRRQVVVKKGGTFFKDKDGNVLQEASQAPEIKPEPQKPKDEKTNNS